MSTIIDEKNIGELLGDNLTFIESDQLSNKEGVIKPMVSIDKFYWDFSLSKSYVGSKNRVLFGDFSEIPSSVTHHCINYELVLYIGEHKITVPFYFENGFDTKMERQDGLINFKEIPNGKKMVRFGVDDNDYEIGEFAELKEFKMGPGITVNKDGLRFSCKCLQEICIEFDLPKRGLNQIIIESIINTFNAQSLFFESLITNKTV